MKTTYIISYRENGNYAPTTVSRYDSLEAAREGLAGELKALTHRIDNYLFIADKAEAMEEIEYAKQAGKEGSWDKDFVKGYVNALREGIKRKAPFAVSAIHEDVISCDNDVFSHDIYSYRIVALKTPETLQELADYINEHDGWDHQVVNNAIEVNGWADYTWDQWSVCDDGEHKVVLNDNAVAEVIEL